MRKINDFINEINEKEYQSLSFNLRKFIKLLFPKIINNQKLYCKYHYGKNINLIISDSFSSRNIYFINSSRITVHYDKISNFINVLKKYNASQLCLMSLFRHHYKNNSLILEEDSLIDIKNVEKEFQNSSLHANVLDYLLFSDKNGISVDYFYYGDARRGYFISSDELKKKIISDTKNNYIHNYMRIGVMNYLRVKNKGNHFFMLKLNILKYIKK